MQRNLLKKAEYIRKCLIQLIGQATVSNGNVFNSACRSRWVGFGEKVYAVSENFYKSIRDSIR